ncbi:hypothetical protein I302_103498 [Kwoniella bestiolae CBS 10118]|uniref:FHA domain-containing protein n=1 Tax=Kwoniella bestiolae CBS 10118 TaxID=1296100 RepID=A0A1B9G8L4_9TREE|nr:hypothetical protein I302_02200 [Kwoniella bestiolae CBS 10118]OCF27359.1 hypothetical protein I302_02200 [Kwoniella bestiolae CBS 10118]
MSEWERDGSPMPSGPPPITYGRLTLMKRKGGGDVQTIPLDAERITFGRDYDCDVRLYYSDVSKLHCEIAFDIISGHATLHVKGTNGLLYTPSGQSPTAYKPPSEIPLNDKDVITIRKKPFRFEYGPSVDTPISFSPAVQLSSEMQAAPSPAKQPSFSSPGHQPIRRRASHRLSLVPEGKTFVPLSPIKNRRHSTLGLGGMGTPAKSASKSKLSEEVPQEQEEQEEEPAVDVANGDEGDKVYLEMNEEKNKENEEPVVTNKPIHDNPFITPQQTRKAPLRNTSAVPRTRKTAAVEQVRPTHVGDKSTSPVSKDSPAPASPPKTPRSVPLPVASDTPYNPPTTSASQKANSTPVPARVALSTPKGPATLRKALLLRSARKVWQESRASGVEGAIEAGTIETRRKSTSPKYRAGRKSTTPIPEAPLRQEDEEMSDEDEPQQDEQDEELKWIQEDGTAEVSFESDSSGQDSLEADQSLDIPGQGVIEFTINHPEVEEEYINNDDPLDHEDDEMDIEEDHDVGVYEEYEQAVNIPADSSVEEVQPEDDDPEEHQVDEDEVMSLPGTPQTRQPLSKQFFTPQPERNIHKLPRRSLANIGAPPVRFERLPATPSAFKRERAPPGSMGKPSRRVTLAVPAAEEEMKAETDEEPVVERKVFATPVKSEAAKAEAKRRRESLATPRQLPAPPASGFKNPVIETRFSDLVSTPSHPALTAQSPEPSDHIQAVPSTPMDDIKKRLDKMRRQSVQRADRRATVGFVLPSTPSHKPESREMGSWSVNPRRIEGQGPKTPIFPRLKKEDQIMECPSEGITTTSQQSSLTIQAQAPSSPEYDTPSSPSTPSYTGIREMLKQPLPAKTPDMRGLKNLFPATPKEVGSPSLVGVKEMLRQPCVPATPNFSGMKHMFQQPKITQTPGFEGIGEMFEEEEEEEIEQAEEAVGVIAEEDANKAEDDEIAEEIVTQQAQDTAKTGGEKKPAATSKLPRPATTTSTSTSTASRSRRAAPSTSAAPTKATTRIPARQAAASTSTSRAPQAEVDTTEPKSKSTRNRRAEPVTKTVDEEPKSRSTRAKRTTSVDPEPSAPSRATASRSRSTRAKSTAEPDEAVQVEEAGSKSTRTKSASTRATRQTTVEVEEGGSKPSRGKKVLAQLPEQSGVAEEKTSTSTSTSNSTRSKVPAPSLRTTTKHEEKVSTSASSRRRATAAVGNKENDDGSHEEISAGAGAKKRVGVTKDATGATGSGVPVPVATRATRSRK